MLNKVLALRNICFLGQYCFIALALFLFILLISSEVAGTTLPPTSAEGLGSTALSNLVTYWGEAFSEHHPAVSITIGDPGRAVGIEALLDGTAHAVLMSPPLNWKQRDWFISPNDYPPTLIPVGVIRCLGLWP